MNKVFALFLGLFGFIAIFPLVAAPQRVAVVVDSPKAQVMATETRTFCEIIERLDLSAADMEFAIRTPDDFSDFDAFDTLLIYQGDEFIETTPLFGEAFQSAVHAWSAADSKHGIVLVGGAAALLDRFGFGPVAKTAITFGNDREQSGTMPVNSNSALWSGTQIDRETVWMTNAVYPAYDHVTSESNDVVTLARPTTGLSNGLLAALGPADTDQNRRAKIFVFPWSVNPLYLMAAEEFRANFETMILNLVRASGKPLAASDWTAPLWTAPDFAALRRALDHLCEDTADYPDGASFRAELEALEKRFETVQTKEEADQLTADFDDLKRRALLANPAIDFDEILFIRRSGNKLGFPQNYNSNSAIAPTGYENRIERLNLRDGSRKIVFTPKNDEFVGDLELHYDADRFLFSMPDIGAQNRWRVWEGRLDSDGCAPDPKPLDLIQDGDVDNYDACYLPDDRLIFCSTACFTGVPCIDGSGHVCNLYLKESDGKIRQLTVEQDHDWCPTVMNNGRVMYLRWEYTDLPHCYSRIMFHMNPDGTNQSELYGSGSYWPEAMFFARPIPDDPTRFVAIVTGHHEEPRVGDLVLFDPGVARREADGALQRIPGFGKKVSPKICDLPIGQTWPKFTHPYPIDGQTFLVSCKCSPEASWTLCLVDLFDNIVPLASDPGYALFEPVPLRKSPRQPSIPDRIKPSQSTADVFIADIYAGRGMKGVKRGTVKSIRVISYQFAYQGMGAEPWSVGLDGPWDPKRILGTVPVLEDGSASFEIPAMTPVALQPLDAEGKAVQLMRSWITAMPGESVSCLGCHEEQNETGATTPRSLASRSTPAKITPFHGPVRGFSFDREIQPILDRYCVECHQPNSEKTAAILAERPDSPLKDASFVPSFLTGEKKPLLENGFSINTGALFSPSYFQLRRFVRTPTKESQMPTHKPFEFHADSTRLVQLLQAGHYGVELDSASWDRLIAWIDLNAPCHGNWGDIRNAGIPDTVRHQYERRKQLRALYAGDQAAADDDPTAPALGVTDSEPDLLRNRRWMDAAGDFAVDSNHANDPVVTETIELSDNIKLTLATVPGTGYAVSTTEVTNAFYRLYDPTHETGMEYGDFINFSPGELGYALNRPTQPAARVTWEEAAGFCAWLTEKTGRRFELPSAELWEYAAEIGTGALDRLSGDYALNENLGDLTFAQINPFSWLDRPNVLPIWRPADLDVNDRSRVAAPVGSYAPNRFGLYDMLGNVAEWTATDSIAPDGAVKKVVAGLSWATPKNRLGERRRFDPQMNVYDVGFRVVSPAE